MFIDGAIIRGALDLTYEEIDYQIVMKNCIFENQINLDYSRVNSFLEFDTCHFISNVSLFDTKINKGIILSNSICNRAFDISVAQIGQRLEIKQTRFDGGVYLNSVTVGNDISLWNSKFKNKLSLIDARAKFIDISSDTCYQEVDLVLIECKNLNMRYSYFQDTVKFSGSEIKNNLTIENVVFNNLADFNSIKVGEVATFGNVILGTMVNFELAKFNWLILALHFKYNANIASIGGLTFNVVKAGINDDSTCTTLLNFFRSANEFAEEPYIQLEKYFEGKSNNELANKVFIEQKKRIRELSHDYLFIAWDYVQENFYGYGRYPFRAFYYTALFFIVGYFLFNEKNMIRVEPNKYQSINFSRMYYNFDLLIPFVRLPYAEIWLPKSENKFAVFWYRIERTFGWITITVGILALTGVIK